MQQYLCYLATLRCGGNARAAIASALIFIFLSMNLLFASTLSPEMVFIAGCLAAFLAMDHCAARIVRDERAGWFQALSTGVLCVLPFWIRYAGAAVVALELAMFCLLFVMFPRGRRVIGITVATMSLCVGLLLLRNHLCGAGLSGHPIGIQPGENLFTASVKVLFFIACGWIPRMAIAIFWIWKVFGAALVLALLGVVAWGLRSCPRGLLALTFGLVQLAMVVLASSITRIDELNERFVIPSYAFLAISLGVLWGRRESLFFGRRPTDVRPALLGALFFLVTWLASSAPPMIHREDLVSFASLPKLALISLLPASALVLAWYAPTLARRFGSVLSAWAEPAFANWRRLTPSDFGNNARRSVLLMAAGAMLVCWVIVPTVGALINGNAGVMRAASNRWSPKTIAYIRSRVPAGSAILANGAGWQLMAATLDYRVQLIPFINPENGDYDKAYGAVHWDREAALRSMLKNGFSHVVFFQGADGIDPLLTYHSYGDYVPLLLRPGLPEVEEIVQQPDGIVVRLVPPDRLRQILKGLSEGKEGSL